MDAGTEEIYSIKKIATHIRSLKERTKEGENCFVCGQCAAIAHLHHVIPVYMLSRHVKNIYDKGNEPTRIYIRTVYLCPNHHAFAHKLMKHMRSVPKKGKLEDILHKFFVQFKLTRIREIIGYTVLVQSMFIDSAPHQSLVMQAWGINGEWFEWQL